MTSRLEAWAVEGIGEIVEGTDLAALLCDLDLRDGDVVLVTSKVVSKAEGRVRAGDREQAIRDETVRVVARRGPTQIVENHLGHRDGRGRGGRVERDAGPRRAPPP